MNNGMVTYNLSFKHDEKTGQALHFVDNRNIKTYVHVTLENQSGFSIVILNKETIYDRPFDEIYYLLNEVFKDGSFNQVQLYSTSFLLRLVHDYIEKFFIVKLGTKIELTLDSMLVFQTDLIKK